MFAGINLDEAFFNTFLEISKNQDLAAQNDLSPGIAAALQNGFDINSAIEAVSVVGDNPEMVLQYLFN